MIGSNPFETCFGSVPAGDEDALVRVAKAAVRAGFAIVVDQPGGKKPLCTLPASRVGRADREAREAGLRRHACGLAHALTDPDEAGRVVGRLVRQLGPVNLGIEVGRSRMIAVDIDNPGQLEAFMVAWRLGVGGWVYRDVTVRSPGSKGDGEAWAHHGGGHFWFSVPDGVDLPTELGVWTAPEGWAVIWADHQVLVPPSRRAEGAYELVGEVEPAPDWLLDTIRSAVDARKQRIESVVIDADDPIDQWSAATPWEDLLPGWFSDGMPDNCGCPIWTAPGDHASPKSATAHEVGCERYDTSTGWGPLHIWTDAPPVELAAKRTWTKKQVADAYGIETGDLRRTESVVPELPDFRVELQGGGETSQGDKPKLSRKSAAGKGEIEPKRHVRVQLASDITPRATIWTWRDEHGHWIPAGGLTLLGGREGIGKSTIAYEIVAKLTNGKLPGRWEGKPKAAIVSAAEDDWSATIVPRLIAAGADLSKVMRVDVVHIEGYVGPISLPEDTRTVRQMAEEFDVGMLLLDPLLGGVSRKLDTHKDADVRQALEPLVRLLAETQMAGLGLIHVNKTSSGDLLSRLMGSRAFSAVARAVLMCTKVDSEGLEEIDDPGPRFAFGQEKNNLAPKVDVAMSYMIEGATVGYDDELRVPITSSRIRWLGAMDDSVSGIVSKAESKPVPGAVDQPYQKAAEWIRGYLREHGPTPSAQVRAAAPGSLSESAIKRGWRSLTEAGEGYFWSIPGTNKATMWSTEPPPTS